MSKPGTLFVLALVFVWVNRLPAPIVEEPQKPTPIAEQSEAPKPTAKHSTTSSQARTTSTTSSTEASSAAGGSMNGPRPKYSQAARDAHLSGTGTYLLHFDTSTGAITDVTVTQSTGSAVLDQAAIDAFRQWHAQPNGKKEFPLTISSP